MPTTARRRWCVPRAIRCWQKQTYPDRELIVVGDGLESVADLVPADPRISYVHLPGERVLGAKFNECLALAPGPYLAFWDDDDWHSPKRLAAMMDAMAPVGAEIAGTSSMLAYRPRDRKTFLYKNPLNPLVTPYLIPGTIVFAKSLWATHPFPELKRAVDTHWIITLLGNRTFARVDDPWLYIAMVHEDNTGNGLGQHDDPLTWEHLEHFDIRALMDDEDAAAFLR